MKFNEWHRGSDRVKLRACDKIVWGEKCHYASEILFEWPHVNFVILLSYYIILRESEFLWKIKPQSYPWYPNCLENFSVAIDGNIK